VQHNVINRKKSVTTTTVKSQC